MGDMKPVPLAGRHVRLEPFDETLRASVRGALDCDPDAWQLFAITDLDWPDVRAGLERRLGVSQASHGCHGAGTPRACSHIPP
jgi:hypothetical protein